MWHAGESKRCLTWCAFLSVDLDFASVSAAPDPLPSSFLGSVGGTPCSTCEVSHAAAQIPVHGTLSHSSHGVPSHPLCHVRHMALILRPHNCRAKEIVHNNVAMQTLRNLDLGSLARSGPHGERARGVFVHDNLEPPRWGQACVDCISSCNGGGDMDSVCPRARVDNALGALRNFVTNHVLVGKGYLRT
jgi:hypothetical protein